MAKHGLLQTPSGERPLPSQLPPCDLRVLIDDTTVYCRHTLVVGKSGIVPAAACRTCDVRTRPCAEPRPVALPDQMPSLARMAWNVAAATAAFVADGAKTVSETEYKARLDICELCDRRRDTRCLECGCRVTLKARGRAFRCPLGKWDQDSHEAAST